MNYQRKLQWLEQEIITICRRHDVSPDALQMDLDRFTWEEEDRLLELLNAKLECQEAILEGRQDSNKTNVVSLADYRRRRKVT